MTADQELDRVVAPFIAGLHWSTTVLSIGRANYVHVERGKERVVTDAAAVVTYNCGTRQTWTWAQGKRGIDRVMPEHLLEYRITRHEHRETNDGN